MPFIFDNVTAGVIGMSIFLILASIQLEAMQLNTARTARNMMKGQAQELATWMEEDLAEMGKNMSAGEVAFEAPQDSTQWHTIQFTFKQDSLQGGSRVRVKTRYELEQTGTRDVDGTTTPLYEVRRSQKVGSGAWQSRGRSTSNLEYFEVNLLDENGTPIPSPVANTSEVESIRVRYSVVAPFQNDLTFPRRARRSIVIPYRLAGS